MKKIVEGLWEISLGLVNAHLIDADGDLVLIDTGSRGNAPRIEAAMATIGKSLGDLSHLVVTHCHSDHSGSLHAIQSHCDAITIMHEADAQLVRRGTALRPLSPSSGLLNDLLFRSLSRLAEEGIERARVDQLVHDDQLLEIAGGIKVMHAPGHTAGQIVLLWKNETVLFAADCAMHITWLAPSLVYEDHEISRKTLQRIAERDFEIACFGHGRPIKRRAAKAFRNRFGGSRRVT